MQDETTVSHADDEPESEPGNENDTFEDPIFDDLDDEDGDDDLESDDEDAFQEDDPRGNQIVDFHDEHRHCQFVEPPAEIVPYRAVSREGEL